MFILRISCNLITVNISKLNSIISKYCINIEIHVNMSLLKLKKKKKKNLRCEINRLLLSYKVSDITETR